jgi:hypothetical protein
MNPFVRNILAAIAGIILGNVVNMGLTRQAARLFLRPARLT